MRGLITNNYLRGAITGLGLVNVWLALSDLSEVVAGRLSPGTPSSGDG